jgi:hypothetical protein
LKLWVEVWNLLVLNNSPTKLTIEYVLGKAVCSPCPQQQNGVDCGLFAVAIILHLLEGIEVTETLFCQKDISNLRAAMVDSMASRPLKSPLDFCVSIPTNVIRQFFPLLDQSTKNPDFEIIPTPIRSGVRPGVTPPLFTYIKKENEKASGKVDVANDDEDIVFIRVTKPTSPKHNNMPSSIIASSKSSDIINKNNNIPGNQSSDMIFSNPYSRPNSNGGRLACGLPIGSSPVCSVGNQGSAITTAIERPIDPIIFCYSDESSTVGRERVSRSNAKYADFEKRNKKPPPIVTKISDSNLDRKCHQRVTSSLLQVQHQPILANPIPQQWMGCILTKAFHSVCRSILLLHHQSQLAMIH